MDYEIISLKEFRTVGTVIVLIESHRLQGLNLHNGTACEKLPH